MNSWKVIWNQGTKRFQKTFQGDSPREAVAFGKALKSRGLSVEGVVSGRKAYAPPQGKPRERRTWCPYCVKYRDFSEFSITFESVVLAPVLRCPVCHISIMDGNVRRFNPILFAEYQIRTEARERAKTNGKAKARL